MAEIRTVEAANLEEFISRYSSHFPKPEPDADGHTLMCSPILFRGHSHAAWKLQTTLERYAVTDCRIRDYVDYVMRCIPEFASYTGRQLRRDRKWLHIRTWKDVQSDSTLLDLMVELRHFGFPSPLLDWTLSPHIAAYFAYRDPPKGEHAAIFALQEWVGHGKGGWVSDPQIHGIGPYIETTDRHHIQQAQYTICSRVENEREIFVSHESRFELSHDDQDFLVKFVLPPDIREAVLDQLQLMNINEYTLFRSTEGLCHHLAYKHIRKR